jgi:transposase
MQRSPQGKSTKEFREEAVKMVTIEKISLPEAARRLSLPSSTLGNWLKASKTGKLGEIGKNYRPLTEVELELARTRKELVEVKMERDILKKAAAYFAREASPHIINIFCGALSGVCLINLVKKYRLNWEENFVLVTELWHSFLN